MHTVMGDEYSGEYIDKYSDVVIIIMVEGTLIGLLVEIIIGLRGILIGLRAYHRF